MTTAPPIPGRIRSRDDLAALLAATTNYEQRLPRGNAERHFDLTRMERLLAALGDPHLGPRVVHVAGSKGKGTVTRLVAGLLRQAASAGTVGSFTSPHLQDLAERIAIDGRPVDDPALVAAADALLPAIREAHGTPHAPTFFELFTAIAWLVFRDAGCTHVVLETGLGGRLDATNVSAPACTVITTIELEHTHVLGDTIAAIAAEKAGILKPGVPAITTAAGDARDVIRARAAEVGAPLLVVDADPTDEGDLGNPADSRIAVTDIEAGPGPRLAFRLGDDDAPFAARLPGAHHAANAASAVCAVRALEADEDLGLDVHAALAGVRVPGLLEPVQDAPRVLIDGAHTPRSAAATRHALESGYPGRRFGLVLAALDGKDVEGIFDALVPGAAFVITTPVDSPRAVPADDLADALRPRYDVPVHTASDPAAALAQARALATGDTLVLATGSVYLAGAIRDAAGLAPGRFLDLPAHA